MLNREKHQLIMGRILRDIYAEPLLAPALGLKGGTAAYFFYGLPRFSVDLDFDALERDEATHTVIQQRAESIGARYGAIKDSRIKRQTIFLLVSYGDTDHNIKIEISTRVLLPEIRKQYELREHLGISMLVATQPYLFASKLAALTLRSETAMRDIYDVWYFASNNWDIETDALKAMTGKGVAEQLADCIALIELVKEREVLHGIGELLSEKDKTWVKQHLLSDAAFLLKNYQAVFKVKM